MSETATARAALPAIASNAVPPVTAGVPDPRDWAAAHPPVEGSWWPEWAAWLRRRSSRRLVAPPRMAAPEEGLPSLGPAPGTYVFQT